MNADDLNPKQVLLELERPHKYCGCYWCQSLPPIFLSGQQIRLHEARSAVHVEWFKLNKEIRELQERLCRVNIALDLLDAEFQKICRHQTGQRKKPAMPIVGHHFEDLARNVAQLQALFDEQRFIANFRPYSVYLTGSSPTRRPAVPQPEPDDPPEAAE